MNLFGDRLKELRKNAKMTQEDLGERFNVAKNTISYWESNITKPDIETIVALSTFFGVSTDYLLGMNEDDTKAIDKVNQILKENNMLDPNEKINEDELKIAIDQVRQYQALFKRVIETDNKYSNENKDAN